MNLLLLNILLAAGFMALRETYTLGGLLAGFAVGYGALWLTRPLYAGSPYFRHFPALIRLLIFFIKALIISNLRVLWDVITPSHISRPGIIRFELAARTGLEIMLVALFVSLTPGTLAIDLCKERRYLYVHVMFLSDVEDARRELKEGLERRVLAVLR